MCLAVFEFSALKTGPMLKTRSLGEEGVLAKVCELEDVGTAL